MMKRLLAIATLLLALPAAAAGYLEVEFVDGTTVEADRNEIERGRSLLTLRDGTTMDVPVEDIRRIRFVFDPVDIPTPPAESAGIDVRWQPEEGFEPRLAGADFAPSRSINPPVAVRWEPDEGETPAWRWEPGQGSVRVNLSSNVPWWRPQDGFDRE